MSAVEASGYRPDIDGLRTIAVTSVLAFHFFPARVRGGFVGVDVFFVISGFLISGLILNGLREQRFSFIDFYARRVRRIFPALILVLIACLSAGASMMSADEYRQLGRHVVGGGLFVSNFVSWGETRYFDVAAESKPLLHLWSLGVEEQFYLLWPCALWLMVRFGPRQAVWQKILLVLLLSFGLDLALVHGNSSAAFYLPLARFWELLIGALLACSQPMTRQALALRWPRMADAASLVGLALILGSVFALDADRAFPGWWAVIPGVGAALLIAAGRQGWVNRQLLARPLMVGIGLISYPLYLWHWPLLVFVRYQDADMSVLELRLARLAAIAVALLLAWLTWRFVELPLRRGPVRVQSGWLAMAMSVTVVSGMVVVASNGFPSRMSDTERQIAAVAATYRGKVAELYRTHTCFLLSGDDPRSFATACSNFSPGTPGRGGVLLWGDSHAAHLYPGLRAYLAASHQPLTQLTAGDCPPLPDHVSKLQPKCPLIFQYVAKWAHEHHPQTVLLAADWPDYAERGKLTGVINRLKKEGVEQVVVVGPVAMYPKPLPVLLRHASQRGAIPERMRTSRMPELSLIDQTMRDVAEHAGAQYVSPLREMCDGKGCLATIDGSASGLVTWDNDHLTDVGSTLVVDRLLNSLLDGVH